MVATYKTPILTEFDELLGRSKSAVIAEYRGLSMKQLQILRRELRNSGAEMKVVKNTLARIACRKHGMEELAGHLKGPLAFILSYDEVTAGPKAAITFAKGHPKFQLRGGYVDGQLITADEVKVLGLLPGKDGMRAMLLGSLMGIPSELIQTITARIEQLGGAPAEADAPAEAAAPAEVAAPTEAATPADVPVAEAAPEPTA